MIYVCLSLDISHELIIYDAVGIICLFFLLPGIKMSLRILARCMLVGIEFVASISLLPGIYNRCFFFLAACRVLVREPGQPAICEQVTPPMINLRDSEAYRLKPDSRLNA